MQDFVLLYRNGGGVDEDIFPLRNWVQVLRNAGYKISHDTFYPSRNDGNILPIMSKQLIYNAGFSRRDALTYSTNRTISYSQIAVDYPREFFKNSSSKSIPAQMYDSGGQFYLFIESIRHDIANGMIHGEVIDSVDSYSERCFLTQVLEYCKTVGIKVIPKEKAYDICFNESRLLGNLVYNPTLRNTAKEFMHDSEKVPNNPDGYRGSCAVVNAGTPNAILMVYEESFYLHYGIPIGNIEYSADIEGSGKVCIYSIKNSDCVDIKNSDLDLLAEIEIFSGFFENYKTHLIIPDNPLTKYEQICEGLGNKIMGIKIVYFGKLKIKNIRIELDIQ